LGAGIVRGIAGLGSYALYEAELISANSGANLILFSFHCAVIAIPIGLLGARWANRRGEEPVLGQAGAVVGAGTLAAWFVVLVYALGR
jgi:hypothetical protein